jgi:hypothetical protein
LIRTRNPIRAILLGIVLAFTGGLGAFAFWWRASSDTRTIARLFGPGRTSLVAGGDLFGDSWKIFAHDERNRQCLVAADRLFANERCFFPGGMPGAPVDFATWTGGPGASRSYYALLGAVPPEVARVVITIGSRRFDFTALHVSGFDLRFFVKVLPGAPPRGVGTVSAFDDRGRAVRNVSRATAA